MSNEMEILIKILIFILLFIVLWILYKIFRNPFKYPYFEYHFDVSGRKNPKIEYLIDEFLIDGNFELIEKHKEKIINWKNSCHKKIDNSILKRYRMKQYSNALDSKNAFIFYLIRKKTKYSQSGNHTSSYKVDQLINTYFCDFDWLYNRNEKLKLINYVCPLDDYYSKNQRKLLTKDLRNTIIKRDNYTCQICGKYMPDEVGLQVDHIVPISKGGKTIASNLQVLCSKCNGKKSNKFEKKIIEDQN